MLENNGVRQWGVWPCQPSDALVKRAAAVRRTDIKPDLIYMKRNCAKSNIGPLGSMTY